MNKDFFIEVIKSSEELTAVERIQIKDISDTIKLDEATTNGAVTIYPAKYALLHVHNEKSKGDKDYNTCVIFTTNGERYITGSRSFLSSLENLWDDYCELLEAGEPIALKIYRKPSQNYKGKDFLTCSVTVE